MNDQRKSEPSPEALALMIEATQPKESPLSDYDQSCLRKIFDNDGFITAIERITSEYLTIANHEKNNLKPGSKTKALRDLSNSIVALEKSLRALDVKTNGELSLAARRGGYDGNVIHQAKLEMDALHRAVLAVAQPNFGVTRPKITAERFAAGRVEGVLGEYGLAVTSKEDGNAAVCMRVIMGLPDSGAGHYFKPSRQE